VARPRRAARWRRSPAVARPHWAGTSIAARTARSRTSRITVVIIARVRVAGASERRRGRRNRKLLPVPYFLVTFTVPEELRPLFAAQPQAMHEVLFRESAA